MNIFCDNIEDLDGNEKMIDDKDSFWKQTLDYIFKLEQFMTFNSQNAEVSLFPSKTLI